MEHVYKKLNNNDSQSCTSSSKERTIQNKAIELQDNRQTSIVQRKANNTGLPANLKSGIENLSGHSMDDVKVHYNSSQPAQLNAHAYAQGTDIHIANGQEKHLPHEAWHVVQQKQGRVKPTLQMKGKVNVNDDAGLEKEADVMGGKAMQLKSLEKNNVKSHTTSNPDTVQRAIIVGINPLNPHEVYDQMLLRNPKFEENRLELIYGILPAYYADGKVFTDINQLIIEVNQILQVYGSLYHVSGYKSFAHYLHNQKLSQAAVKANPTLYKSMVTTVGFEHEFADMKNSPLAGVSHMTIAKSTTGLPFTGIKFLVETDASNALELVSPPFLFPTTNGSTVPMSDAVSAADTLMKSALYNILTQRASNWIPDGYFNRKYIDQTINQLLLQLNAITGFTFQLKNNIQIKPSYLSHNTALNTLKNHVAPDPLDANKMILNPHSLGNINVSKSEKGERESYSISSQVNFATDMNTASKLQQLGPDPGDNRIFNDEVVFKRINEGLRAHIPEPAAGSPGLAAFYPLLIARLSGLFSVYSQDHVRNAQAVLHADLVAKATPMTADRNLGLPTAASRREFNMHAGMMSFVKDMTPAWIKDHILSLAKGMLVPHDYPKLLVALKASNVSGFTLPANIDSYLQDNHHSTTAAHWVHFIAEIQTAILKLKNSVEYLIIPLGSTIKMDLKPKVELYEHDNEYIGARQDTYQDPQKVQMPQIHPNKRLHVTEIRRGDPSVKLRDLERDL
jgi:hypothetical protein